MIPDIELITPNDKPALLGVSTLEWLGVAKAVLTELGYKVHAAGNHEDFLSRFNQVQYHVVVLEELFGSADIAENFSLRMLQQMQMGQRRHAAVVLLGPSFQTLHPLQAFQYSVNAVVNQAELALLGQIVEQTIAENNLFLHTYRDVSMRQARGERRSAQV